MKIMVERQGKNKVLLVFEDPIELDKFMTRIAQAVSEIAEPFWTITEIVQRFDVDRQTVYYFRNTRQLVPIDDNEQVLKFKQQEVIELMKNKRKKRYTELNLAKY
jgi:transposase-like protein